MRNEKNVEAVLGCSNRKVFEMQRFSIFYSFITFHGFCRLFRLFIWPSGNKLFTRIKLYFYVCMYYFTFFLDFSYLPTYRRQ